MLDRIDHIVGSQHVLIDTEWLLEAPDEVLVATIEATKYQKDVGFRELGWLSLQRLIGFNA